MPFKLIKKMIIDRTKENHGDSKDASTNQMIPAKSKSKNVWAFNAANTFTGNPKWLFIYVNKYRPEIDAYWFCDSDETTEFIRSLGYKAYTFKDPMGFVIQSQVTVFAVEQVKEQIPSRFKADVILLNMYHGVGCKTIERKVDFGFLNERITKKYIRNNQFYFNNQLFLVTSPLMEQHFREQVGIEEDKVIRAGYPRCIYNLYKEKVATFDHDFLAQKGLPKDTKIAVYAPTYRDKSPTNFFNKAIPDFKKLVKKLEENNILLIFKMHPLMEKDHQFVQCKERYADCKNVLFWDNNLDFYEIMNQVDLAIVDYSSIFYDLLAAGVNNFIRYIFDYEDKDNLRDFVFDVKEMTFGSISLSFDELLGALDVCDTNEQEERDRINELFWAYSDENSFDKIIDQTLAFKPTMERELPTLYTFDVFDTVFARKVLSPFGIFYYVKDRMKESNYGFSPYFIDEYIEIRKQAESNVREFYIKTLVIRDDERREITFDEIFVNMQTVYNLTDEQVQCLKQWELEAEIDNVIPIKDRIQYIYDLVNNGETVILISDMYLPKDIIIKMLTKADPMLATLPLFLSSELGVQKTTKKLFYEVYRSFDIYNFKEWIHHGDNKFADGRMPKQLGITTVVHDVIEFNDYEKELVDTIQTYDAYLVAAAMARFRENNMSVKDYFAYAYASLYFVPYVKWAIEDAMARGIQCLYFISRDGHQLKRIADTIIQHRGLDIKTKYIYGSRRAWRLPSFVHEVDREYYTGFGNFAEVTTFKNLLKALSMDEETYDQLFPELMYVKELEFIDKEMRDNLTSVFKYSESFNQYILNKAAQERKIVLEYLNQEIDFSETFAFVEYWGRGYTQECFTRLVHCAVGKEIDVPYYYVRSIYPTQGHNVRYNYSTNRTSLLFVEAIFANIPYKSIKRYERENGVVVPVIEPLECDTELFQAMEKCLVMFADWFVTQEFIDEYAISNALANFGLNYYSGHQIDEVFVQCLAPLIDSVGTYGEKEEFAPALSEEILAKVEGGGKLASMTRSVDMTLARSEEELVERYSYLTETLPQQINEERKQERISSTIKSKNEECKKQLESYTRNCEVLQKKYDEYKELPINNNLIVLVEPASKLVKAEYWKLEKLVLANTNLELYKLPKTKKIKDEQLQMLATAKAIIVSKVSDVIHSLNFRKETEVIQLNECAFNYTKFGLAKEIPNESAMERELNEATLSGNYTLLSSASEKLNELYKKSYGIQNDDVVKALGACCTDIYFDSEFKEQAKHKFYELFPEARNTKVIFYMPSYRFTKKPYKKLTFLELDKLYESLQEEYVMVIHNNIPANKQPYMIGSCYNNFVKDLTGKISLRELFVVADIIVGDYRNAIFEAPLLNKPVFLTARDYKETEEEKQIYFSYGDIMPGVLINDVYDLIQGIENADQYDYTNCNRFKEEYLTMCDGHSSERILKEALK